MNNLYKYKTKCGLDVIYYQKKDFYKSYCGIGCKFGSANLKYEINNQIYNMKDGIAHFIEHKLFQMPNGIDAYFEFDKLNTQANAYTTQDKTVYFFKTLDSVYEPLKLLLEMYFTPYFTEEDVNKEKDIIISEINMTCDNIDFAKNYEILKHTYPNDDYSTYLTGSIDSVKSINSEDLSSGYNSFYTPDNSVLTIVSSNNPNDVFNFIENCLSNLNFSKTEVNKLPIIKSKNVLKPKTMDFKVSQNEVNVILRLDNLTNENSLNIDKLMTIFDNLFSISNKYTNKLLKKKLFENDIDFECTSFKDSCYAVISAPSKKGEKFAKEIIRKLNNLSFEELDSELLDIRLKYIKSDHIISLDNIDYLGDQILSLALEDMDYFDLINNINNLNINSLKEIINEINNCEKTYIIFNSKKS